MPGHLCKATATPEPAHAVSGSGHSRRVRPVLAPPLVDAAYSVGYKPTVTEPERPADAVGREPHARRDQCAPRGAPEANARPSGPAWPGECRRGAQHHLAAARSRTRPVRRGRCPRGRARCTAQTPVRASLPVRRAARTGSQLVSGRSRRPISARPDWSELRLRTPVDEVPTRGPPGSGCLTVLLARRRPRRGRLHLASARDPPAPWNAVSAGRRSRGRRRPRRRSPHRGRAHRTRAGSRRLRRRGDHRWDGPPDRRRQRRPRPHRRAALPRSGNGGWPGDGGKRRCGRRAGCRG